MTTRVPVTAERPYEVAVGRGVASGVADALGGELGATRPVTEELHWLPEDLCIHRLRDGIEDGQGLQSGCGESFHRAPRSACNRTGAQTRSAAPKRRKCHRISPFLPTVTQPACQAHIWASVTAYRHVCPFHIILSNDIFLLWHSLFGMRPAHHGLTDGQRQTGRKGPANSKRSASDHCRPPDRAKAMIPIAAPV